MLVILYKKDMMQITSKIQTGIWIDGKEAFLIRFENGQLTQETIQSGIEDFHPVGGARSKTIWGPMDKMDEKKLLERRKQQEHAYHQQIIERLGQSNELYIFGPAEQKVKLRKELLKSNNKYLLTMDTADKMTQRQRIAKVRDFFNIIDIE